MLMPAPPVNGLQSGFILTESNTKTFIVGYEKVKSKLTGEYKRLAK